MTTTDHIPTPTTTDNTSTKPSRNQAPAESTRNVLSKLMTKIPLKPYKFNQIHKKDIKKHGVGFVLEVIL
jgi:hypothetical protein